MHDIKLIRTQPEVLDGSLIKRGLPPQSVHILKLDFEHRETLTALQELQTRKNEIAKEIGIAKRQNLTITNLIEEGEIVKSRIPVLEEKVRKLADHLEVFLLSLPNLVAPDVPVGDETANQILAWNTISNNICTKEHFILGEALGLMDFETATKMSGSRFVVLKGHLARLERALGQFMLDQHTLNHNYLEVSVPLLVKEQALIGTGQLPKFADDLFKAGNSHWLIPTAEVSLTNLVANEILNPEELPLRYTALTPCFRAEAGSAGKDTRGMIRQHQFNKVELVSITLPEKSNIEHQKMLEDAESILIALGFKYRTMLLSSQDMGFSAQKTYDLEVWLSGQQAYREIASISNCGDFQARRMNARYKDGKLNHFLHTLNGSGVAVGRALVAILETYQNPDGSITIPTILRPYMGNLEKLGIDNS